MKNIHLSLVDASYLAEIGRQAFPGVREPCDLCRSTGILASSVHGIDFDCPICHGLGFVVREMTAREEHYWIIHLIKVRTPTPVDLENL